MRFLAFIFVFAVLSNLAQAQEPPQFFNLDGRLYDAASPKDPLKDPNVDLIVQVLNPAKDCVLYEEQQTLNTQASEGYFNIRVGSPTAGPDAAKRSANDSGNSLRLAFQNKNLAISGKDSSGVACSYTPVAGDARHFRFIVTPSSTGVTATLSPDMSVDSVPHAVIAESVQGMVPQDFIQVTADVTQAKADSLFGGSYGALTNLLGGTSSLYLQNTANGTIIPVRASDPAGPSEGQIWFDSVTNQVKYYDGGGVQALGISGGDPTKLPLAGGTMTGDLDMGGKQVLGTSHITMSALSTITLGQYSNTDETTLVAALTAGNKGAVWYNSDTNKLMHWTGAVAKPLNDANLGTSAGNLFTIDSIPHCAANQKLEMSAGPVYTWSCASEAVSAIMADADNNTKLQVEESANEDKIRFDTAGTERAIIDSTGNLGIGTSTPQRLVHIYGAGTTNTILQMANDATGGGLTNGTFVGLVNGIKDAYISQQENAPIRIFTNALERMTILGDGSVGIGTITPGEKLEVNGKVKGTELCIGADCRAAWPAGGDITDVTTGGASGLTGGVASGNANISVVTDGSTMEINGSNQLQVKDAGVTDSKIIGMDVSKLTSATGSSYFTYKPANGACAGNGVLKWNAGASRWDCGTDNDAGGDLTAITAGTGITGTNLTGPVPTINVDIGTAATQLFTNNAVPHCTAAQKLEISAGPIYTWSCVGQSIPASIADADNDTKIQVEESADEDKIRFDTGGAERMIIDSSGNVGIGTATSSDKLQIGDKAGGAANRRTINLGAGGFADPSAPNTPGDGEKIVLYDTAAYKTALGVGVENDVWVQSHNGTSTKPAFRVFTGAASVVPTEKFTVLNSGNVGIGTPTPIATLDVVGTMAVKGTSYSQLQLNPPGAGTEIWVLRNFGATDDFQITPFTTNGDTPAVTVKKTGNVGVGIAAPAAQLAVYGAGQTTAALNTAAGQNLGGTLQLLDTGTVSGNGGAVVFGASNSGVKNFAAIKAIMTNASVGGNGAGDLAFSTRTTDSDATMTEKMRILSSGNVGIGTASPGQQGWFFNANTKLLELTGSGTSAPTSAGTLLLTNNRAGVLSGTETLGSIVFSNKNDTGGSIGSVIEASGEGTGGIFGYGSNLRFQTKPDNVYGPLTRMTISSTGNVGIGTTSPSAKLDVVVPTASAPWDNGKIRVSTEDQLLKLYSYYEPTINQYAAIQSRNSSDTVNQNLVLQPQGGNVGIGTTSVTAKLEVVGQIVSQEFVVASGATADFSKGNSIVLQAVGTTSIALANMVAGGVYNVVVEDTTARTYSFTGCGTVYASPALAVTSNRTVFSIYRRLNSCYISWVTGFN